MAILLLIPPGCVGDRKALLLRTCGTAQEGLCSCHASRVDIWFGGWDAELSTRISLDILDFESAIYLSFFF